MTAMTVRLFLFLPQTAFVIAADDKMIRQAVRGHFSGVELDDDLVTNYFDKLIQVPIRVPPLGTQEVRAYLMLLYLAKAGLSELQMESVRKGVCERLSSSWSGQRVDLAFVRDLVPKDAPALSDLLADDPGVDISSLTSAQIDWVLERHLTHEIVQRIELDVGKSIVDKAPSPASAIERMKEMREYVEESVSAAFRDNRQRDTPVDSTSMAKLSSAVIRDTFSVFEEYVE